MLPLYLSFLNVTDITFAVSIVCRRKDYHKSKSKVVWHLGKMDFFKNNEYKRAVLHNNCTIINPYENVEIYSFNMPSNTSKWSANDARFILYKLYLPHLRTNFVFYLDSDVEILKPPTILEKDYLYIGNNDPEKINHRTLWSQKMCLLKNDDFYLSAGIIGGSKNILSSFFEHCTELFYRYVGDPKVGYPPQKGRNINMLVVNCAARKTTKKIKTGFPIHNRFLSNKKYVKIGSQKYIPWFKHY